LVSTEQIRAQLQGLDDLVAGAQARLQFRSNALAACVQKVSLQRAGVLLEAREGPFRSAWDINLNHLPAGPVTLQVTQSGVPPLSLDGMVHSSPAGVTRLEHPKGESWILAKGQRLETIAGSPPDLAQMGPRQALDFSGYALDRVEMHHCNYNWKTFIEVYLEDYHVGPFHPGLGQFVSCEDLRWEFQREFSVQTVGVANQLKAAGSAVYQRWHQAVMQYRQGKPPEHGAIWLTYYPHIMVEWYPHVLTVSTLHPISPTQTMNMVEFYYPEEIVAFERDFVQAQQAAYMETCLEDDEIAERMDAGRHALMRRGDDERGPYQSPMEDGMQHFHEWYRQRMAHSS